MFAEMNRETIPFKIFGKTYEIYKEIPASLVLELARHEQDEDLGTAFLLKAGRAIFGDAMLDEICSNPSFSASQLGTLIRWAFQEINGNGENAGDGEEITEDDTGAQQAKN
mgnify:CR=1 FL=1